MEVENTNPEPSRIDVLENKIKLMNNKQDECVTLLKKLDHKMYLLICRESKICNFLIKSEFDLQKMDEKIGEAFDSFVRPKFLIIRKIILPGGLKKNLAKIICEELVMNYNFEGIKGKSSFKQFHNLNKALYEVSKREGYTQEEYAAKMKKAIHLIKVRQFKKTHFANKNK